MRKSPPRHTLPPITSARLGTETAAITGSTDPTLEASLRYGKAREAAWFKQVIRTLGIMAGVGERCMYCSGSESAQVEHYRPKTSYPHIALEWSNLLWICGVCNQAKGNRFDESNPPINPVDEDVWSYFFIDQFGNLAPRWNVALNSLDPRAVRTIELQSLDRQALQECRQERLIDLRNKIADSLALFSSGQLTLEDLESRALAWLEQPFQPDVADYFFAGPGVDDDSEPFKRFVDVLSGLAQA